MKPKGKILSLLLVIYLVVGIMPTAAFAEGTDTGKAIQFVDSGTAANISGGQADYIYFGTYQQSSAGSTMPDGTEGVDWIKADTATSNNQGPYYYINPVKWRVLSNADGRLFLISDQNLDMFQYHEVEANVTWEISTMRSWLNGLEGNYIDDNFIDTAFSDGEQEAIAMTTVVNDDNLGYGTEGGNNTIDKIFLLSIAEASSDSYFADNSSRISTNTAYVAGGGKTNGGMYSVGEGGDWWLRSPGKQPGVSKGYAATVNPDGSVDVSGYYVHHTRIAVRPAFNLDTSKVLFTSAAENGKTGNGLQAVSNYDGNEWKMTLLDDSRDFAVTETTASSKPGETIQLKYTGATTGENEFISAIIADNSGAQYYGRVAQPSTTDGEIQIKIPDTLAAGEYTLNVFSEQYNGDYKTDYASAFEAVALTVLDSTTPTLSDGTATRDSETSATVKFTSDEAGTYYYAVVESDKAAPAIDTTGTGIACDTTEQTISLNNLSGAGAKDIYIVAKDAAGNVSSKLKIKIPAYIVPIYGISESPAALNFGSKTVDYKAPPAAQAVTLTNTGNQNVTVNLPTSTNYIITAGEGFTNDTATLAPNGTAAFTVQPKTGLGACDYFETLTISGSNSTSASVELYFEVLDTYTLTVNLNGGSGSTNGGKYPAGETINIDAGSRSNYRFNGWTSSNGGTFVDASSVSTTFTMPAADTTVTANWTAETYSVKLNTNNGIIADGKDVTSYTYGTETTLPTTHDITRTGYTFDGWYEQADCSGDKVTAITATNSGSKEYWAKWTVNTYDVTLNANGGTIADSKDVTGYTYGTETTLPTAQDITHTGFTFGGWYDNADFSGEPVTGITSTDFGNKTYYAKWTAEVTLYANGGTIADDKRITSYTYGTETPLPMAQDITRTGFTFDGWYANKSLIGEPVTAISADATGDKEYWAKWTTSAYGITVQNDGNGEASADKTTAAEGETVTLTATPNSGYHFERWEVVIGDVTIDNNTFIMPNKSVAIKAIFARDSTVTPSIDPQTVSEEAFDAIQDAQPGETVMVDLSHGDTTLDKEVFEELAGQDITLDIDLGDGLSWTVNGTDIPEDTDFVDIDMGVTMNSDGIPVDLINAITGEYGNVQVKLAHDGAFGFIMTLTAPVGEENAGYWANLYHFDEDAGKMTFETAAQIGDDGSVSLAFNHASHYAIVFDNHNHGIVELPFTDVSEGDWFYNPVVYVYENGLMTGTSDTTFAPNVATTRGMLVSILHRLEGAPSAEFAGFSDVSDGDWYAEAVNWAASVGVVNGFEDGTFQPNAAITREQMAAILRNYAEYKGFDVIASSDLSIYTDASNVNNWAKESVEWMVSSGLIGGYVDNTLRPQGNTTRAEASAMLQRYLEASEK